MRFVLSDFLMAFYIAFEPLQSACITKRFLNLRRVRKVYFPACVPTHNEALPFSYQKKVQIVV